MHISSTEPSSVILSQTKLFKKLISDAKINLNKQIRRIVVPRAATNLTLKKVKGQGHGMVPIERDCHNDHACQISMLYL